MSAQELRNRAKRREEAARLETFTAAGLGVALSLLFAWSAARSRDRLMGIGWGVTSLACLYFARQARAWLWPGRLDPGATLDATASFYRSILERRRDYERHIWSRSGLPFLFAGIAIALAPPLIRAPQLTGKAAPFLILLAVWFLTYLPLRRKKRRLLQQEIDELRGLEDG
jgi:hypothetical protein